MLGELNRKTGNAAGPTLDQDFLAGLELQRVLDGNQRSESGECQRRLIDVRDAVGFAGDDRCLDRDLLAIGALLADIAHTEYRIAPAEIGHALADMADEAGKVAAEYVGECRNLVAVADPHLPVRAIDAGGVDVDHHLSRPGNGIGEFAQGQHLGSAKLFDVDCFHDRHPLAT